MSIINKVKQCGLLSEEDRILVAVSGGPDSVALLDLLCCCGYDCVVAHCNFHLRGNDSNQDAAFVRELAVKYELKSCFVDFDTLSYASNSNLSVEMAARELRYKWFDEMADLHGCQSIAVAHNANDVVETFFLNLLRGTGIKGLTGIAPKRGRIVRPLLGVSRKEIMQYIAERGLDFRTDKTNDEVIFVRNKIRHQIIPIFESINPSFLETMLMNISHLCSVNEIVSDYINELNQNVLQKSNKGFDFIDCNELKSATGFDVLLYDILKRYDFSSHQIDQIVSFDHNKSGKRFYSHSTCAVTNRGIIELHRLHSGDDEEVKVDLYGSGIISPVPLKMSVIAASDFVLNKSSNCAYFDIDKLKVNHLCVRHWRPGDWFVPFGMVGKKKVRDLLTEYKLSVEQKRSVWLLTAGDDIMWVIGHRADNRFRVDNSTKNILVVECCM